MCGICGIIDLQNNSPAKERLRPMLAAIKHRGPDDEGVFAENHVVLGFVRLSIIDLSSAGHQPMLSDDGRYVLVFNGEIFNYLELRAELTAKGYLFHTNTDTEVLLKSYLEWGEECLYRFNGMWAFVIYDRQEKKVFASRDRFGVKPFYYCIDNSQLLIASEIPPLLSALKRKPKANNQAIFDFLAFNRTDQTEETFFEGIKKLQHGSNLSVTEGKLKIKQWYKLRDNLKEPFQSPEEYGAMFKSAIDLRLRSDVPVGVCLSGGLDSSGIVSVLLNEHEKNDLNTFSAVYNKGQLGDESEYIAEYQDRIKNMFYTTPNAQSLYNDLHHFVRIHAEPIPTTSPYAQYKVMELAQKNVVVTLDGQGADEQLAGYHYFFGLFFKDLLKSGRLGLLSHEIKDYLKVHKSLFGVKSFAFFMLPASLRTRNRVNKRGYIHANFSQKYAATNSIAGNLYASKNLHEALLDHFNYKLEHLLKWEDRNSMFFSLEARTPFLDYRLVERTLSLAATDIIKNGVTKHILRQSMRGKMPEKIRMRQDKIGFGTPQDEWFREPVFKKLILEILNSDLFRSRMIVSPEKAIKIYERHLMKKGNYSKEIWKWLNLELWFRAFID